MRENLNPSISEVDAIEMLSQHLITRPVFDALFGSYEFSMHNPVSMAMQKMLDTLEDQALEKEVTALDAFYSSVRERATGIDNAEGRQKIVIELYDKFFRTAFPRVAERLGIVYTPVEVVDFIVNSVSDVLKSEFDTDFGDKDVHVIDPFTGTGTFIVRLLQSGYISPEDLLRKYQHELHANEIILLAYYIAAINIEETFHGIRRDTGHEQDGYVPFEGIVLTDTFQLSENTGTMVDTMFPENNLRVRRQKSSPIRVIIGNPPYSAQQGSENDNNQNLSYPRLDSRIRETYAESSSSKLLKNLYDSYIRAIRWASDRIADKGIIGFVTNGSFLDSNNMDGLRARLAEEFSTIFIFNLRGNARTQGEQRKMEKGNVFGSGTRTPVAVSLLIKNPANVSPSKIYYRDIGDYLDQDEKLALIKKYHGVSNMTESGLWSIIHPNSSHDWLNARDPAYERFLPLGTKEADSFELVFFENYSLGVVTNRDAWTYNMSRQAVQSNIARMIDTYNQERQRFAEACRGKLKAEWPDIEAIVDADPRQISWTRALKADAKRDKVLIFDQSSMATSLYRPFVKEWLYFNRRLNEMVYQMPKIFPTPDHYNVTISVTGIGATKDFSALVTNCIPNLHLHDTGQCFPLYLYEPLDTAEGRLNDDAEIVDGYRQTSAITDRILDEFRRAYEPSITKEDIFYYVYGVLHSPEYRLRFANDLKKMLPRIPLTIETADFWKFSKAGRDLAEWHLNYETVEPYEVIEDGVPLIPDEEKDFIVQKMAFGRKDRQIDKTTIIYNSRITLSNIPIEAYDYIVNGKPAIEWIMERYQITVDKDSGIRNDPNDWSREHNQPRYIIDLLKRIVRVSIETIKIVRSLPPLNER
ncbi:MAG: N-6 DNA methylase [Fimbriimonadaceae bacterium]|nr:N-6 DNA methylase [Fimbriimonadaceae bacterium]